jgi:hypothetical protein
MTADSQLALLARARSPKRHAHFFVQWTNGIGETGVECRGCGIQQEAYWARQRRARNNVKRGKHYEHGWAERLGMRQTGGLNKEDDALNEMFVGQAKSMASARFPGWMALELDKLRARWADRIPILGVLEAAGQGKKGRRLIVVDEQDWIALHVGNKAEKVIGWIK